MLMMIKKVKQASDIVFNQVDDELVMMNIKKGVYLGVNTVGAAIWEKIQEPTDVEILIKQLMDEFDVTKEICQKETISFLEQAIKHGVIEICE